MFGHGRARARAILKIRARAKPGTGIIFPGGHGQNPGKIRAGHGQNLCIFYFYFQINFIDNYRKVANRGQT